MKRLLKLLVALIVLGGAAATLFLFWPLHQREVPQPVNEDPIDVVLIGGGVMSITLATYLTELQPDWKIQLFERLDGVALESSNGWNNAGTGHSGFAELNYTPELEDGMIETKRAVAIADQFEISRQFWAHQVTKGKLSTPTDFINPTPHMRFVWGGDNIQYLHKRHQALIQNPLFYGMEYSEDPAQIAKWAPLMMEGRDPNQKIAATYMPLGTDVNFGVITNQLTASLRKNPNFDLHLKQEVTALRQNADKTWNVTVKDLTSNSERTVKSRFVFIGAGGASLKLLQLSGIPESKNYAGFPVGGQFLAAEVPDVTSRHSVKAYGKAEAGSPPMSVPHLDARKLEGKPVVLFGPFALYSTKFLKEGTWFDLFSSITNHNVLEMSRVGIENLDLVKYLMSQAVLTDEQRYAELHKYFPNAKNAEWKLITAGQRVQVIKKDPEKGAILQFGTEIVTDQDHTIAALLGASPGASTSPNIMLQLIGKAFPEQVAGAWQAKLKEIVPSYGRSLNDSPALTNEIRKYTSSILQLPYLEVPTALNTDPAVSPTLLSPQPTPDLSNKPMQAL